jgi:GTP-binding protein
MRIVSSKFITSAVKPSAYPETDVPDFAFVGRSNVGKSSMINALTGRKLLAKIANTPGKTRLINFFECGYISENTTDDSLDNTPNHTQNNNLSQSGLASTALPQSKAVEHGIFTLVDLPGYGYAKVSKKERDLWKEMIGEFFLKRQQLRGVVVLVDIRHAPDPKDIVMIQMLQDMSVKYLVVATKCDKIPQGNIYARLKCFRQGFGLVENNICECSAVKKVNIHKVLKWIETYL